MSRSADSDGTAEFLKITFFKIKWISSQPPQKFNLYAIFLVESACTVFYILEAHGAMKPKSQPVNHFIFSVPSLSNKRQGCIAAMCL